ncbi:MAG: c-type cytochrome [Candidatus Limnocylindrales bacterium]
MTDDRTGRELTPRPSEPEGVVSPREPSLPATPSTDVERFAAGEQTHTVGLTEERSAQIVRQTSNSKMIAFLAVLIFVVFIPLYWLYDIGLPVIGIQPRLEKEANEQYVTDVGRGYALFLANCARCHGNNGEGGIGPPLNDQMKLFNAVTQSGLPGPGHLNADYIRAVLTEGGRYVCGDPKSAMPAWLEPKGPLNYREVEEIITYILASQDTEIVYQPTHVEGGGTIPPPVTIEGWRDPAFTPAPGATPVPDCWRAPTTGGTTATPAPITSPGTVDSPRVVEIEGAAIPQWVDPASDQQLTAISVVQGETVEFHIINQTTTPHNFHIGSAAELSTAPEINELPGVDTFINGTQTFTHTFDTIPDQPQFACTVPGHYPTMNGGLVVVAPGGGPAASPGASGAPAVSAAPNSSPASSAAPAATP